MSLVVLERAGIDDAAILEGEPGLLLEERDVLDEAEGEGMLATIQHAGVKQAVDIGRLHRPVADAALRPLNLNRRLEPVHAARAGAHDLDVKFALLGGLEQSACDLPGTDAKRARVPRNEHPRPHACASFSRPSSVASSSMGAMAKSKAIDGLERDAGVRRGFAELHAKPLLGAHCQLIAACGLAGFGAAKL